MEAAKEGDEGYSELISPAILHSLSAQQKLDMGVSLLATLPPWMISTAIRRLGDGLQRDFVNMLPLELSIYILSMTSLKTIGHCAQVSKAWNRVCQDDGLWKRFLPLLPNDGFKRQQFTEQRLSANSGTTTEEKLTWRYQVKQANELLRNWRDGRYTKKILVGHNDGVYTCQFDQNVIISGSRDSSIKIWDLQSGDCIKTIESAHEKSVLCLHFDDEQIVTGSSDYTIRIWDRKTLELSRHLTGHTDSVLNIRVDGEHIISGSRDRQIKVWNRYNGKLLRTLFGHSSAVNAIAVANGMIVSGSGDRVIKVWEFQTGKIVRNLVGHERGIACIQFDGKCVVSGSSDQTIRVWDVDSGNCLHVLKAHSDLIRSVAFNDQFLISGSYDETIKIWNMKDGRLMYDLRHGHLSQIYGVRLGTSQIVSCGQDGRVVVWNFGTDVDTTFFA